MNLDWRAFAEVMAAMGMFGAGCCALTWLTVDGRYRRAANRRPARPCRPRLASPRRPGRTRRAITAAARAVATSRKARA